MGKFNKYKPNKLQVLMDNLHKIVRKGIDEDKSQAQMICNYYVKKGYLSSDLKKTAKELIDRNWSRIMPRPRKGKHYLYAITDGVYVKLGMSQDYENRIKVMQTSTPHKLKLEWCCYVSEDSREAYRQENKLHRAMGQYHVRGEWFTLDCLEHVKQWKVRNRDVAQEDKGIEVNESLDEEFRLIIG